ncbi:MAG: hypothetical protein K2N23_00740 [Clostridia bacterium]|nr:hypothetical protein [Clostridia bacterium]
MVKYNGRKIVYTFKYGVGLTKRVKVLFIGGTVFLFISSVLVLVLGYLADKLLLGWLCCIFLGIASVLFLVSSVYFWRRERRIDWEVLNWLTDEKVFEATAIPYVVDKMWTRAGYVYKYGLIFEKNGIAFKKNTEDYDYMRIFYKAVKSKKDKEINFLYSPKYGEVMVFENEKVK